MSVYKVPQDVEAEDKLVGPFTLKQFIFLVIAAISAYLTFALSQINPVLVILPLPFVLVFGFLGVYRRPDQPVEIYLTSLIRFHLKSRRRIWDQDGIMEPVHITAPPKVEHHYSDGLSQGQISSRLNVLANTMDTRGWSSKNSTLQTPHLPQSSDRLITRQDLPSRIQPTEVHASDDILDYSNNGVAQAMNNLAQESTNTARQNAVKAMKQAPPTPVVRQPQQAPAYQSPSYPVRPAIQNAQQQNISPMTPQPTPDIIRLSQNSDLNVSTIARQVEQPEQDLKDNTEISLR